MPYQYILANLLARNDDAVGVVFLDGTGETVDLACCEHTPYEMRVVAAYLGITLRQVEGFAGRLSCGEPRLVHIEKETHHIYIHPLPEGYCLALVQRRPALVARARQSLAEAAEQLRRELFA